jgi:hypothetical protein
MRSRSIYIDEKKTKNSNEIAMIGKYKSHSQTWMELLGKAILEIKNDGGVHSKNLLGWRRNIIDSSKKGSLAVWKIDALLKSGINESILKSRIQPSDFQEIFIEVNGAYEIRQNIHLKDADRKWVDCFLRLANQRTGTLAEGEAIVDLDIWMAENASKYRYKKLSKWKMSCIEKIQQLSLNKESKVAETEFSIRSEIGEKSMFGGMNSKFKYRKIWLSRFDIFVEYAGNFERLRSEADREMSAWLAWNCKRFAKNQLSEWKMVILRQANFDKYCAKYFLKLGVYAPALLNYKKATGSYTVKRSSSNDDLYKWSVKLIAKMEPRYISYLGSIIGMSDSDKVEFCNTLNNTEFSTQSIEDSRQKSIERHKELTIRFSELTCKQTYGILRRLSSVSVIDTQEMEVLIWTQQLNEIMESIPVDSVENIFDLDLDEEEESFLKRLVKDYSRPTIHGWKRKFIEEYGLQKYKLDPRLLVGNERNMFELGRFYLQFSRLDVDSSYGDEWLRLSEWRKRIVRELSKIKSNQIHNTKRYQSIKSYFQSVGDDELMKFFSR